MDALRVPKGLSSAGFVLVAVVGALMLMSAGAAAQVAGTSAGAGERQVTFTKDVAPILQRSCQHCHRPGSIAPMSLLSYEDVRPWARAVKQRTGLREMPPWYIDRRVGIRKFNDDPSLSDEEIATIAKWVDTGAAKGDLADMPPARKFEDLGLWHIKPDLVVTLPKDEMVPADGPDEWRDIIVNAGLTEDRWMKAIETKPSKGFQVVHHSATSLIDPDDTEDLADNPRGGLLNEYALGKNGDIFPDGSGRLIKAGSKINFNLHLHPIGEVTAANVELGLEFYPAGYVPKHQVEIVTVGGSGDLDIPPNTDNVRVDTYYTLTKPVRLLSFQPHMHNRGKAMCVEAIYQGDGRGSISSANRTEPISCVDRYQFAWHLSYHYAEDVQPLLPAGTILHITGWHDNSSKNRFNPDPDQWAGFGQRTVDDMSFAWIKWINLTEEEFKQQVDERKAKTTTN